MWTYEKLLAKHLKINGNDICRVKALHYGMAILCHNGQEYAVGKPGFTENYYGPELKLSDTVSAYRITPENPDWR
jgi:hypothetical protein